MGVTRYLSIAVKWWWLVVASVLLAAAASYFSVSQEPRVYQAVTTLMVGRLLSQANPDSQEAWLSEQLARTYADMARRQVLLRAVADELGLSYTPVASVYTPPGTNLFQVFVHDTDPERAEAIAGKIIEQLILRSPAATGEAQARQDFIQSQLQSLETSIQEAQDEIMAEQQRLEGASSARAIQDSQANIGALQQKLASYRSTYASLLQTVQTEVNQITVVDPPLASRQPISPKVTETIALSVTIGLAMAVAGIVVLEYLDDTIKSSEDVMRSVELPTLGNIARIEGRQYLDKLVVLQEPRSPIAEAYRVLRTNIQFSAIDKPVRTLMVTSPNPIEGKSITVANLAVVMAQSDLSVIVVDTDLRRPVMHKVFGLDNSRGLSDAVLNDTSGVLEYVQPVMPAALSSAASDGDPGSAAESGSASTAYMGKLRVLTSGPLPPNPAELLGSASMKKVIKRLRKAADIVIFDSPPTLAVTDATVLATQVDGVIIVNDAGRTRRMPAKRAVERLLSVDAHLMGVVLNRLSTRGAEYYRYYYAEGGNGRRRKRRRRPGRKPKTDAAPESDPLPAGKEKA